jgi:hypothetical protein
MKERSSGPRRRKAGVVTAAVGAAMALAVPTPAHATAGTTGVYIWATGVNMRTCASTSCPDYGSHMRLSRIHVDAHCQRRGDAVRDGAYANDWWVQVDAGGPRGWVSAVYVSGGGNWEPIPGVSQDFTDCA